MIFLKRFEERIRRDEQTKAYQRVNAFGLLYLPRWQHISTHYEGCYERHPECAVRWAADAAGNYIDRD